MRSGVVVMAGRVPAIHVFLIASEKTTDQP